MLHGEELREFDELDSQNNGSTNAHLKEIQEVLLAYFPSLNAVTKQKFTMGCAMRNPHAVLFKRFTVRLTKINNYLPMFPRSDGSNNMDEAEHNKIILHAAPNRCYK